MDLQDVYMPILKKTEAWIWYAENCPKSNYFQNRAEHDLFRTQYDLDCVLTGGNLYADTIFSLWIPLRFALVRLNTYAELNKIGSLNNRTDFLTELTRRENLERLLPPEHPTVLLLSELFALGQTAANVMLLPERWLQKRGQKPYYDYMPYFLYECFQGGVFSSAFSSDAHYEEWIQKEKLEMFFAGAVQKENLLDLANSGSVKSGIPPQLDDLLRAYLQILKARALLKAKDAPGCE